MTCVHWQGLGAICRSQLHIMMPGAPVILWCFSTSSSSPVCVSLFPAQWAQRALWSQQCLCVHPKCTSGWQFFYGIILDQEFICRVTVALCYPPPSSAAAVWPPLCSVPEWVNPAHTALISVVPARSACAGKILPSSRGGTTSGIK